MMFIQRAAGGYPNVKIICFQQSSPQKKKKNVLPDLLHAAEQGSSVKVVEVVCNVGYFETGSNNILILSYSEAYRK